jgi:hypothetical protein
MMELSCIAVGDMASKNNFERRNKTALGPRGQAVTSLKNEIMAFLVTM